MEHELEVKDLKFKIQQLTNESASMKTTHDQKVRKLQSKL